MLWIGGMNDKQSYQLTASVTLPTILLHNPSF